jgi:hypothetical protein
MAALGEHLTAGRISLDEYGDRSAHAAHAQTRGELAALFADLPEPHPDLAGAGLPVPVPVPVASPPASPQVGDEVPALPQQLATRRALKTGTTLMWAVAVPLLFILAPHLWWLIFVPIAVSIVAGQYLGHRGGADCDRPVRSRRRR